MTSTTDLDFIIIGAGISGIGAACHLVRECPSKRFAILEQRAALGGTWDIFRYPGIRCDSDMYSLGYAFRPWPTNKVITDGGSIREYLRDTAEEYGVDRHIRYGHRVTAASWSSGEGHWNVRVLVGSREDHTEHVYTARFLLMCPGYFKYEQGFTPDIPGLADFAGDVIHPQFWPEGYDHAGKRVVVIGSGATAVTIVPAMANTGADVTMLQRSPTYYVTLPDTDPTVKFSRVFLPDDLVARMALVRNTLLQFGIFNFCRRYPHIARRFLLSQVERQLRGKVDMRHFTPRYDPWDERVCAVPNGDLFEVFREGRAQIVTDHIERIDAEGVQLRSGRHLPADVIVTATGFDVRMFGGVAIDVDGDAVDPADRVLYNAAMMDGVPNFAMIFGYPNVSWTRKVDTISGYLCRLVNHMDRTGKAVVVPRGGERFRSNEPFIRMTSGYVQRSKHLFPKQGEEGPWRTSNNVILDTLRFRFAPLRDGHLEFLDAKTRRRTRPGRRKVSTDAAA